VQQQSHANFANLRLADENLVRVQSFQVFCGLFRELYSKLRKNSKGRFEEKINK
jgi:hypothetical protein